jgi:hypothetical protein
MTESRGGVEKYKMSLVLLVIEESKEVLRK